MKNNYKNEKGIVLPIVVIVFSIMLILGFSMINTTDNETKLNKRDEESKKALQYAEAGYNAYLWHLNDDVNFYSIDTDKLDEDTRALVNGEDIEFRDGFYKVNAEKPSDTDRYVKITSTGWTKTDPSNKRTVVAKIRKKQFVHQVYVSDSDGSNIWWTTGDECHGPYHTNGTLRVQKNPQFFDTVTYSSGIDDNKIKGDKKYVYKAGDPKEVEKLEFPMNNEDLKEWAAKDNMVFQGRTCIYLDGDKVEIRNGNSEKVMLYSISNDIKNGVIYVEGKEEKSEYRNFYEKFDLNYGNVFISGTLKGRLTIAAKNNIYITASDPTIWDVPSQYTAKGIEYYGTKFNGKKDSTGTGDEEMSALDREKGIYTRYAMRNGETGADGKDMLGLVANNDIMVMHYGWFKYKNENDPNDEPFLYHWKKEYYFFGHRWVKVPYKINVAPENITIHAAVFAVNGGFGFEQYRSGVKKGNITLWGNITQRERKEVGTFDINSGNNRTGYKKRYAHDPRMFYDYPPHILEPTNVGWEVIEWKEININEEVED
ncbi:pilus assembly PilX N-terminal domain-containing protein [Anaerosalibacter sp. Marseille-P3206]|uniref:pilus assembly PilX N-terminal domain-containing protein n=1 Tax=Anaerosalibacter sp. Marseille-P3206 TaxID=1871005 RepID=UPI0009873720|nr:pilus assembly PilX N-terminal domain-containing protein [Anaerosalibacter sp. Marseille-P3206]